MIFPIQHQPQALAASCHRRAATCLPKPRQLSREPRRSPPPPWVPSPSPEVHRRPRTLSPKLKEEVGPSPAATATRCRPKVSKMDSPHHPKSVGENPIQNQDPVCELFSTPASHRHGQGAPPSVAPPPHRTRSKSCIV
jgi:hypothetical protein